MTISYTDLLAPTAVRQYELLHNKLFLCGCPRCADPRELGSDCSAVRCSACLKVLLPLLLLLLLLQLALLLQYLRPRGLPVACCTPRTATPGSAASAGQSLPPPRSPASCSRSTTRCRPCWPTLRAAPRTWRSSWPSPAECWGRTTGSSCGSGTASVGSTAGCRVTSYRTSPSNRSSLLVLLQPPALLSVHTAVWSSVLGEIP